MEVSIICINGHKYSFRDKAWGLDNDGNLYIKYDDGKVAKIINYAGIEIPDRGNVFTIMGIKQLANNNTRRVNK